METKVIGVLKQFLQLIGLVVVLYCIVNGAREFWYRGNLGSETLAALNFENMYPVESEYSKKR